MRSVFAVVVLLFVCYLLHVVQCSEGVCVQYVFFVATAEAFCIAVLCRVFGLSVEPVYLFARNLRPNSGASDT